MWLRDKLGAVSPYAAACIAVAVAIVVLLVAIYVSSRRKRARPPPARAAGDAPSGRSGGRKNPEARPRREAYDPEDFGMAAPRPAPPAENPVEPDPEEVWNQQMLDEIGGIPRHALGTVSQDQPQLRMSRVPLPATDTPSRIYQTEYDHPDTDIGDA